MSNHNHSSHKKTYFLIWITLIVLTFVTVESSYMDFGAFNMIVAMLIATTKAMLVCLYFMHLKEDNKTNNVVFFSSFLFLALLVGLSIGDIFTRPKVYSVQIHKIQGPSSDSPEKMGQLKNPTPELVAKGKTLFQTNCVTCHGAEGLGDGPASAALNPKPRNFTATEGWKNGRSSGHIYITLTNGVGAGMPAFGTLPAEERWALVHYVRSFMSSPPADTPDSLKLIGLNPDGSAPVASSDQQKGAQLPIDFAIEKMLKESAK